VIRLYRFGPAWGKFGCISQFVLKIETYLRMAGIEFETCSLGMDYVDAAPKGRLPYIEHNGVQVADSGFILDYLKAQFGDLLDAGLSPTDRAHGHTIKRMVEEHIWWVMARERWWSPQAPYQDTPGLLKELEQTDYEEARDDSQRKCVEHGVGAFTEDELERRGQEDIDALATLLGEQDYFFGERPTSVDATTYAFLWQILNAPYASRLKDAAARHDNLVAYTQRISVQWFADDPMSLEREVASS
jgi:glutathione S-transferase